MYRYGKHFALLITTSGGGAGVMGGTLTSKQDKKSYLLYTAILTAQKSHGNMLQ
jgi:hypothetical protein